MIEIVIEPSGEVYKALIALALRECSSFSLVMRPSGLNFDQTANDFTDELASHLISENSASSWPGTQLLGDTAVVRHYKLDEVSARKLLAVSSLYSWQAPVYPEDLAFYGKDGSVWMGSVAHEEFAFFENPGHSKSELKNLVPGLHVRERWQRESGGKSDG